MVNFFFSLLLAAAAAAFRQHLPWIRSRVSATEQMLQSTSLPANPHHVQHELLSAGWPCSEFSHSGVSVRVLHRPSDSLHSVFSGDLEFEADAGIDSSGLDVWSGACNLLCSHISSHPELLHDMHVLELGSGMGVCGLYAAHTRFRAESVALTDAGNFVIKVLSANAAMNAINCIASCRVFEYAWGSGAARDCVGCCCPYDVIIASDLVYSSTGARLLAQSVKDNLKPGGVFLMAHTKRYAIFFGEDGQLQRESSDSALDEFCASLCLTAGPSELASTCIGDEEIVLLQWTC